MYVHPNDTQGSTTEFLLFEILSVCVTHVYIHCLTIHFLAVQIWFFNVTKYQNRTPRQSSKVGAGAKLWVI